MINLKQQPSNIQVIIRSANERTESLCAKLIHEQVSASQVTTIHERPFHAALQRSFEIGIAAEKEWTLCIDADVLILPGAIDGLLSFARSQPADSLGASGKILDKLRYGVRYGGLHLYRSKFLPEALTLIRHCDNFLLQHRPETFIKDQLREIGYNWNLSESLVGIHDFEQYYTDIFRKMVVRSNKSSNELNDLQNKALINSQFDPDFRVALWGIRVGKNIDAPLLIDSEQWRAEARLLLVANGIEEKSSQPALQTSEDVQKTFRQYSAIILAGKHGFGIRRFFQVRQILSRLGARLIQYSNLYHRDI